MLITVLQQAKNALLKRQTSDAATANDPDPITQAPNLFLATPANCMGSASLRRIEISDLPELSFSGDVDGGTWP